MPVQINEIVIRAVVDNNTAGSSGVTHASGVDQDTSPYTDALDQLLELLKEKKER